MNSCQDVVCLSTFVGSKPSFTECLYDKCWVPSNMAKISPALLYTCSIGFLPLTDGWCNRHKKGKESGKSNLQIVICKESFPLPNWKGHSSPAFLLHHVSQLCDFSCKQSAGIYNACLFSHLVYSVLRG